MDELALHMLVHDLRHTLRDMRTDLEQVRRAAVGDRARAGRIDSSLARLGDLESLASSLAQARGAKDREVQTFDVAALVRDAVEGFMPAFTRSQCLVTIDCGGPTFVSARRGDLVRALQNLLQNALEAMPQKSRLHVRVYARRRFFRHRVRIKVHNTGSYIPPTDRAKIFAPYFTRSRDGQGLGLAIVKAIIERSNGFVECWSHPYVGTEFVLDLPEVVSQLPVRSRATKPMRLVFVDDDIFVRDGWLRHSEQHLVEAFASPQDFWRVYNTKILTASQPLVVITDYFFANSEQRGFQFAQQIRKRFPHAKVYLASAINDLVAERELFDGLVDKQPQSVTNLLQTLLRD